MGEMGATKKDSRLSTELESLMNLSEKGVIVFSLGTVSNTSNMPEKMTVGLDYRSVHLIKKENIISEWIS